MESSDPTAKICINTDASNSGLGVSVYQKKEDEIERVLAYARQTLSKFKKNYTILEIECLAVIYGLKSHEQYLFARHFTIVTDHHALC